jgi:4-hydroxybenzoate polyprenyltransferase
MTDLRLITLLVCFVCVSSVPIDFFYDFGDLEGDSRLDLGEDSNSAEFRLQVPIAFYDKYYQTLFVSMTSLSYYSDIAMHWGEVVKLL